MEATKDAVLAWINAFHPSSPAPNFESLNDGFHFYRLLATAAPYCFAEDSSSIPRTDNWILKKTNLSTLVTDMTRFGSVFLKAPEGFDLTSTNTIALDKVAKGEDMEGLVELAEYTVTMAALAGNKDVIEKLRGLEKERQVALNGIMKRVMTLHGFKKAVAPTTATAANAQMAAAAAAQQQQHQQPSVISPNNTAVSAFGSLQQQQAYRNGAEDEDATVLRGELNVLRNELRDKSAALDTAESKCAVAEQQLEQLQARYRNLLEESETRGESAKERELQRALTAVSKKEEELVQLRGTISDLDTKVRQLRRDAAAAAEEVEKVKLSLEAEKKKILALTEERNSAIAEKSEVINKLIVTEDRLKVVVKRRDELESELLKKETEENKAIRSGIANAGLGAFLGELATALGRESIASTNEVGLIFHELNGKLSKTEQELERLRMMHGASNNDGGSGGMHDSDNESVSNSSITLTGTNIGGGETPRKLGKNQNSSIVVSGGASEAEVAAAVAAATASLNQELSSLRQQLSDAQNATLSMEKKMAEQNELHQSELETFRMKLKQAVDDAAVSVAAASQPPAELQAQLDALKEEVNKSHRQVSELELAMSQREEEFKELAHKQELEFRARFEAGRKAMKEEQALVTSVVFHCGQRSLALQQRGLLGGASVPQLYKDEGFASLFRETNGGRLRSENDLPSITGDAESFMSASRIAGLWGTMKSGGVPLAGAASNGSRRR